MGRGIESKAVSLTKQNYPKQNYSSPASLKYKLRELIVANNFDITTRKKIFGVFYDIKCQKYSKVVYMQTICAIP